jgi:hypothetical protein
MEQKQEIEKYYSFASKISFFEFTQKEFRNNSFNYEEFYNEIEILSSKHNWNTIQLSNLITSNPKIILLFQELFQQLRFTNAQLIHFIFDISKLNAYDSSVIYRYLCENLKYDVEFRIIFLNKIDKNLNYDDFLENMDSYDLNYLLTIFKITVNDYVIKIIKDYLKLEKRLQILSFGDIPIRISEYLINNLELNNTLSSLILSSFFKNKRIPNDTKSIHGNFPKLKIIISLEKKRYINIDSFLKNHKINILNNDSEKILYENFQSSHKLFCTEKYIDGIIKDKDNKLKKFDLILFEDFKPKKLFEMNYYTTDGTKIGINQNEYIDLSRFIENNFNEYEFYWLTDGNYWLTENGKERYLNLLKYFTKIYNINTFLLDFD